MEFPSISFSSIFKDEERGSTTVPWSSSVERGRSGETLPPPVAAAVVAAAPAVVEHNKRESVVMGSLRGFRSVSTGTTPLSVSNGVEPEGPHERGGEGTVVMTDVAQRDRPDDGASKPEDSVVDDPTEACEEPKEGKVVGMGVVVVENVASFGTNDAEEDFFSTLFANDASPTGGVKPRPPPQHVGGSASGKERGSLGPNPPPKSVVPRLEGVRGGGRESGVVAVVVVNAVVGVGMGWEGMVSVVPLASPSAPLVTKETLEDSVKVKRGFDLSEERGVRSGRGATERGGDGECGRSSSFTRSARFSLRYSPLRFLFSSVA